jgi:hypothetical protein
MEKILNLLKFSIAENPMQFFFNPFNTDARLILSASLTLSIWDTGVTWIYFASHIFKKAQIDF